MYVRARGLMLLVAGALLLSVLVVIVRDAREQEYPDSEAARWVRAAGLYDETPEEVACLASAMEDLLSPADLGRWLQTEPLTITVEELEALPGARAIADRCRYLQPLGE